ncbi:ErfK/YbiS/YcfS/YnhG family protein [Hyphomicrobium denitrificans 1NES1]|uniref:ErfK/YbiS/YcfS/YnhG family protein n=1 Tax=Hyphomicrobium denitrificans 1NES1 TaxID=670307 RepID=N0B727_9HYPH|nr:L,D-transpeptidase family protein [Hyphomicrobium denitrificans]AGK58838.1 ErfK/YbiS/YcfS/YnhG family protein [Hyphomicrobium denitrificans 1NES1]
MNKLSALRALSLGVLAFCSAGSGLSFAAETGSESSASGATTTYFPPSNAPSAPQTTSALPEPDKSASPATTPTEPAPSTAAVTPPDTAPATETATPPSTATATPSAETPASSPSPTESATAPASAGSAQPEAQPSTPPAAAAAAPETLVSPVVEAARRKLAEKSLVGKDNLAPDVAAAADYYYTHKEPLWINDGSYNEKARSVISDLKKADDWGLESSDFVIPNLASNADADAQGAAEAQLTLSALKYARFARGGRLDPIALSNILDMKPPVKDPKVVMRELAEASHPGPFLRGLNPHHEGFEKLRQELLKARGATVEEEPTDPAEQVKLPRGKLLRLGVRDDQVALLRQRLKVPSESPDSNDLYDDALVDAVKDYQRANGLNPDGLVGNGVRNALNGGGKSKRIDPSRNVDRLIANMERWRWLPENLGSFYVMNNIPEFVSEIWKGKERVLSQKMIVGQPAWPTPVLAANMQYVIFHPSWGMPDGIKAKELAPRLRQASSSGFDFFDQLFGGGGGNSGGARVIEAYKLQVYYNGRPVDPNSVNWNTADISRYSFTQPPGPDNPLGLVKFRFPNRHDVYMHDTPERGLFGQTNRALSHGCMRVGEPRRTAEVILQEDKGYSPEKVGELWNSGADVTLSKPVPVYLVYFTARVNEEGRLETFGDIYGNDNRVMSALRGHPERYTAPEAIDPTEADQPGAISDAGSNAMTDDAPPVTRKGRNNKKTASKKNPMTPATTLQDALSSIFLN